MMTTFWCHWRQLIFFSIKSLSHLSYNHKLLYAYDAWGRWKITKRKSTCLSFLHYLQRMWIMLSYPLCNSCSFQIKGMASDNSWERADSWLSFVVSNCESVTFPLVSWVRCGTWLYQFLIFAPLFTFIRLKFCSDHCHWNFSKAK